MYVYSTTPPYLLVQRGRPEVTLGRVATVKSLSWPLLGYLAPRRACLAVWVEAPKLSPEAPPTDFERKLKVG